MLHFLHTNDFHGKFTPGQAECIRAMRLEDDAIWVDSGDCIQTGNLGIPRRPEPIWDLFARGGCTIGTLGNRESHVLAGAFRAKVAGAPHSIVCANLKDRHGNRVYPASVILNVQGLRIGFVGTMVAMVTSSMKMQAASAFLWDAPIPSAVMAAERIRAEVDVLVAITHIGFSQDQALAQACPSLDIIFGGHSHTVLEVPVQEAGVWIAQGGSHGRFVGRYGFDCDTRQLSGGLVALAG